MNSGIWCPNVVIWKFVSRIKEVKCDWLKQFTSTIEKWTFLFPWRSCFALNRIYFSRLCLMRVFWFEKRLKRRYLVREDCLLMFSDFVSVLPNDQSSLLPFFFFELRFFTSNLLFWQRVQASISIFADYLREARCIYPECSHADEFYRMTFVVYQHPALFSLVNDSAGFRNVSSTVISGKIGTNVISAPNAELEKSWA